METGDEESTKISILMAVYNPVWNFLKETLDSVSKQTYKNYEIVIVNDGCDREQLKDLLEDYFFDYKVIENPINLGLPRALNIGLKECGGKYIARIDDDDCMEPDRLRIQLRWMEKHKDCLAIFSGYSIIDDNGNKIGEYTGNHNRRLIQNLLYKGNCLCHSTLFMRREDMEELGGYDNKMIYAQDYDLYLRIQKVGKIYEIPQMLVRFRSIPERISKNKHILSALFSYYATLKNMEKFNAKIFWCRTIGVIKNLRDIVKEM